MKAVEWIISHAALSPVTLTLFLASLQHSTHVVNSAAFKQEPESHPEEKSKSLLYSFVSGLNVKGVKIG